MFHQDFAPNGPRTNPEQRLLPSGVEPISSIMHDDDLLDGMAIVDVTCRFGLMHLPNNSVR